MRGAGVGTRADATFRFSPDTNSARAFGGRVATTGLSRTSLGGLIPRFSLGTKLAGVTFTSGPVWMGLRFFASACLTRAEAMGPRPK
jgi:hypothetical protein